MKLNFQFGAVSNIGRVRPNNEDSFAAAPELNLYVVSDGMGGAASGEVASRLTVETVLAHCRRSAEYRTEPFYGPRMDDAGMAANRLASAVRLANRTVRDTALLNAKHHGMGATVVAAHLDGDRLSIAHVGDSRAYRLRNSHLESLTRDHSLIGEQIRHGLMSAGDATATHLQSLLLRAVGLESEVEVELTEELVLPADVFLLCSDGLTRELSESQIAAELGRNRSAQESAQELVDLANEAGGGDNITALVLRSGAGSANGMGRFGRWLFGAGRFNSLA